MYLTENFNLPKIEKVIFLDFDGPLSSLRNTLSDEDSLSFDPVAIKFLSLACDVTGAKIVCTSTRSASYSRGLFEEAKKYFANAGLDISHMHYDWSVNVDNCNDRKGNIENFLQKHAEITHFVTIDDEYEGKLPNLVLVSDENGILTDDMYKIGEYLDVKMRELRQYSHDKSHENDKKQLNLFGEYEL